VAVLAGLGGGHLDDFAGATLDDDMAATNRIETGEQKKRRGVRCADFFLRAEHCIGYVVDAPASAADSKA
jgi:hypothetical protein